MMSRFAETVSPQRPGCVPLHTVDASATATRMPHDTQAALLPGHAEHTLPRMSSDAARPKITLQTLIARKRARQPITMLTAYDYSMARIEEAAGIDSILVGDSAAQVVLGFDSTLPATMNFMVAIAAAVRRGAPSVFLIGDMPYLSFSVTKEDAIRNAGRFMAEAGCDCVKIEGDRRMAETVAAMTAASIPVMVHLGLRPQAVHQYGGYRAQARDAESAARLIEDARIVEEAGACLLLLEAIPPEPAQLISGSTNLPVIGCGAGPHCDGHVLVLHDILGLAGESSARFVKRYADVRSTIEAAVRAFVSDITSRRYPSDGHGYPMEAGEAVKLENLHPGASAISRSEPTPDCVGGTI